MRKVVIFTAGYGEGHNTAAKNIREALAAHPGVEARVHDPLVCLGERYERSKKQYLGVIARAPAMWRLTYLALDRLPVLPLVTPFLGRVKTEIERTLRESGADTAVCTHPLYPALLNSIAAQGGPKVKVVTIVTDSISINRVWARTPSDLWLVADRYSASRLRALGVSGKNIRTTGFPVSPAFARPRPDARPTVPAGGRARVLLSAGSAADHIVELALGLARLPSVDLTVTVGHDRALGERVATSLKVIGREARILGWVDGMHELLREHHILIGKAGGATTHESLAARTPFIIAKVLPGQEEGNAMLVKRLGVGEVRDKPSEAVDEVRRMLADDARLLNTRIERLSRLTKTDGALRAADAVLAR